MKTNFHTHCTWCDGRNSIEENVVAAVEKGFVALGFSSHAMLPHRQEGVLSPESATGYVQEVRNFAEAYSDRISVFCGVEADYMPGVTDPDRSRYAHLGVDYVIGSIHYVLAPDGAYVPVDHSPELLCEGLSTHFQGNAESYIHAYFQQLRDMISSYDFDVIGHLDLPRKFNGKLSYFDESAKWYLQELSLTADVAASSGKLVEVNTGGISRGWIDDAYPSATFRRLLRDRGARFILSSDSHFVSALDCAFDRFAMSEAYLNSPVKGLFNPS